MSALGKDVESWSAEVRKKNDFIFSLEVAAGTDYTM